MLRRETGGLEESEVEVESTAVLCLSGGGGLLAHLQSREFYGGTKKSLSRSASTSKVVGVLDPLPFSFDFFDRTG